MPAASKSPYPVRAAASLGASSEWGFLAPSSSWYMSPCSSLTPVSSRDRVTSEHPCKPVATAQSTSALPSLPALSGVRPWLGFLTCSGTSLPGFSFTTESGSNPPGGRNPPKLPWLIFKHFNPSPSGLKQKPAHIHTFHPFLLELPLNEDPPPPKKNQT